MWDNVYGCVDFESDKTVSVLPKSRCILRGAYEEHAKVEVKWRIHGKQQTDIGTIICVCPKRKYTSWMPLGVHSK